MPVSTRVRDKGVVEHQSSDPSFCVEIPWCSGSLLPITFFSTIINVGGGAGATGSVTSTTTLSVQSPLSASNSGSTTILALMAPANTILGNSGSADSPASFISFLSAQTTSATAQADPNDVYFGTMTTASFLAAYNQTNFAVNVSDNPLREGASFSGSNTIRLGTFTRKIGATALPVMGIQLAASGSVSFPAAGMLTGSARSQDYIELTSYMGANNNDGTLIYALIFGNASGSFIDGSNAVYAQVARFSENNWGSVSSIRQGGSTIATHTVSGSFLPVTHIGIERNGTVFTVFTGNDVSKNVVLQASSSITPTSWALMAQTTSPPCPVWYLYSLTRNTSATA